MYQYFCYTRQDIIIYLKDAGGFVSSTFEPERWAGDMMRETYRAKAREIAHRHLDAGDPLGWFEALYAQAGDDMREPGCQPCLRALLLLLLKVVDPRRHHRVPGTRRTAPRSLPAAGAGGGRWQRLE